MLSGFVYRPDRSTQTFTSYESLAQAWRDPTARLWLDLEAPTPEELRALDGVIDLDDTSLDATFQEDQSPRVEEFGDHIFLLLYGVLTPDQDPAFSPRKLSAFLGARLLITIHQERHRTIDDMRRRMSASAEHLLGRGVDYLLYAILDGMVDNYSIAISKFDDQLDRLEDLSLTNPSKEVMSEAIDLRRNILELRRLAIAQREAIGPLVRGEFDFVAPTLGRRFNHISHHLTRAIELADNLREILHGIRENHHASLTHRTNEIMRTLTIFASFLLPMSLVAGIYGMNLATWPRLEDPWGFWGVLAIMGMVALGIGFFFRTRKWM